ncbi:MAG: hypothetical protein CMC84_07890 [Flavobacteriaceae bacterium]|mgnify:CR=1 FL=1|nr:hypothetical protein [Flavobacteriaceae bacterium]|tara:strand:- start:3258 stop:4736 length:1479 start_codon:yes stop_codon:yes gene_type:complete
MSESNSLGKKVFSSAGYLTSLRVLDKILSLITIVYLARILDPSAFGLMAMAILTITFLESLTAVSLEQALIQKPKITNEEMDVAWTYGRVLRSVILSGFLFFASSAIANFFGEDELALIIQVMMITQIIRGFENIGMIVYFRDMDFQKDFYQGLISRLIRTFVLLLSAYLLESVWAFVYAYIAASFVAVILSFYFHPYRPKLNFNLKILKSLFDFGGWVFFSQLLRSLYSIVDRTFIGRMLSATFLGYYQIAFRFGNEIPNEIKSVVNQVMFSAYSQLQDDLVRVKKNFLLVLKINCLILLPLLSSVFILSDYLVILFLGENWILAIPSLEILTAVALFQSFISLGFPLFKGLGYPKYESYLLLTIVVITSMFSYPLILTFGLIGAPIALLIGQLIALPFYLLLLKNRLNIRLLDVLRRLKTAFLCSLVLILLLNFVIHTNNYAITWSVFLQMIGVILIFLSSLYFYLVKVNKDNDLIQIHSYIISFLKLKL